MATLSLLVVVLTIIFVNGYEYPSSNTQRRSYESHQPDLRTQIFNVREGNGKTVARTYDQLSDEYKRFLDLAMREMRQNNGQAVQGTLTNDPRSNRQQWNVRTVPSPGIPDRGRPEQSRVPGRQQTNFNRPRPSDLGRGNVQNVPRSRFPDSGRPEQSRAPARQRNPYRPRQRMSNRQLHPQQRNPQNDPRSRAPVTSLKQFRFDPMDDFHRRSQPSQVRPNRQLSAADLREVAQQRLSSVNHKVTFYEEKLRKVDFCRAKKCKPNAHTMCRFKSPALVSPACGDVKSSVMTPKEEDEVLRKHNELRHKVATGGEKRGKPGPQPAAVNIKPLIWNKELAKIAQTWANQCVYEHDECRHGDDFEIGQNIGYSSWSTGYTAILSDMVQSWYDEVDDFDSREVEKYKGASSEVTTHYSQLIWAAATEVGCGLIRFHHPVTSEGYYRTQLVCNYAVKGNMIGQSVYKPRR